MKLNQSRFSVPEVDCPSEEQAIRLAFQNRPEVKRIQVNFEKREVVILHSLGSEDYERIGKAIPFKAKHLDTVAFEPSEIGANTIEDSDHKGERKVLAWLLGLNLSMFVLEGAAGVFSESSGLVADGLDMLADALVYSLSLASIRLGYSGRVRATRTSAWFQGILGILALTQVAWRFVFGSDPEPAWMAGVSALALAVNVACLMLIYRFRTGRMHMQASWIFSANDVVANFAVILGGVLVAWSGSRYPDLIVGAGICVIVLRGALKIQKLTTAPEHAG